MLTLDPGNDIQGAVGVPVRLSGSNGISSGSGLLGVNISWGDGTPIENVFIDRETGDIEASHTYFEPGVYAAVISLVNDYGYSTTDWTFITIE